MQKYSFLDPLQLQNQQMRPYSALSLELLVLTSDNLDVQFLAALQWIYLSKSRRRCKSAVMGLYKLAVAHFKPTGEFGTRMPWGMFPVEQLYSISKIVKLVNLLYFISFSFLN